MTDKELIQAFRECQDHRGCVGCRFETKSVDDCTAIEYFLPDALINRLEALIAENEHLREATKMAPKWVSVTERLPEPGVRVLATDGIFVSEFYRNSQGQWKRFNLNQPELLMARDIRWWRLLPAPPGIERVE